MKFINDEKGAVSADLIAISMVIMGVVAVVGGALVSGSLNLAADVRSNIRSAEFVSYDINPTYDSVAYTLDLEVTPRVCSSSADVNGVVTERCNTSLVSGGSRTFYNMSDGTQWQKLIETMTVYLTETKDSETTFESVTFWFNQLGLGVNAPIASQ